MASNAERSSHLLNLLKFSTQNSAAAAAQQQQQRHEQQPQHLPQQQPQSLQHLFQQHQLQQGQQQGQSHFQPRLLQHQSSAGHFHGNGHHGYQPSSLAHSFQPTTQGHVHGSGADDHDDTDAEVDTIDVPAPRIHQPAPVPADPTGLLAALMRGARDMDEPKLRSEPDAATTVPASSFSPGFTSTASPGPGADTRAYLLNLLNRPKPSPAPGQVEGHGHGLRQVQGQEEPPMSQPSMPSSFTSQSHAHNINHQGQNADLGYHDYQRTLQESAQSGYSYGSGSQKSSYVANAREPSDYTSVGQTASVRAASNEPSSAFQALQEPSPRVREAHATAASPEAKDSPILGQADRHSITVGNSPVPSSHPTPQFAHRQTVAEAAQEIVDSADREAEEALARAEQDAAMRNIANDLENMLAAQTENELEENTRVAFQAARREELEHPENEDLLEETPEPGLVRELDDEATRGPVVDSWESVEQNEDDNNSDPAKEDSPTSVRVFEFPMRPWISISLTDAGTEPRPQFSDKSVMAVAKLKKDFDQVDRTLYTASQKFMVYGMSKAGGIRVIHQDDGLDTKVFTDTNDRIFNVSMPVTPLDHDGRHREAVVGTGLSGTVYWVELVDGERNFWQDAHLEQHGFALPPIAAPDGEVSVSNGALKTRARISNAHPEFFAVGRGKWIHFVWPSLILHKNILKPGHDRVVDTDLLASKCSLRINVGKAGKDLAFSQDDSVIVSLDKSGCVKFWDVRRITTASPDDPLQPAHSSMELTEPILSLSTASEGERAWPTSVMFLDKSKPYHKRLALRYMIVGMNQNHTLQLWDLSLRKPVQELNLPHSKEDDAVCSVMYHANTGMIVIGHPTRNSIYFAHLSAPKYNIKPLSQAEYMHKIAAGDPALPTPDSTAVISGVREYSFSNRGDLRSLDMLCTPAVQQHDVAEPTLFELYAMHSRGVACLIIKQSDLGWSRDNQVISPVSAFDAGAIRVDKLKSWQTGPAPAPAHPSGQASTPAGKGQAVSPSLPFRIASRATPRESVPSPSDASRRDADSFASTPPLADKSIASADKKQPQQLRKRKQAAQDVGSTRDTDSARAIPVAPEQPPSVAVAAASSQVIQEAIEPLIATLETRLGLKFSDTFSSTVRTLQSKIEEGHHSHDSNLNAHQTRLLGLVSDTLNKNNTQQVLQTIVHQEFLHSVVPAVTSVAGKAVGEQMGPQLAKMSAAVREEIHKAVPEALHRALQAQDLSQRISERVGRTVSSKLTDDIVPHLSQVFTDVTVSACQHVMEQAQQQAREQVDILLAARRADSQRIEQLSTAVARLTETVMAMAGSQAQFQDRFLRMQPPQPPQPQSQLQAQPHAAQQFPQAQQLVQHQQYQQTDRPVAANTLMLRDSDRFERLSQRSQHSEYEYQSPPVHGHGQLVYGHGHGHGHGHPNGNGPSHLHGVQQQSPQMGSQGGSQMLPQMASHVGPHMVPHSIPPHMAGSQSQEGVVSPASQTSTQAALSRANAHIARQAHSHGVVRTDRPAEQVRTYFEARQYEKALLAWIQSGNEDNLFDTLLYTYDPGFLHESDLPPLVLMSVATTVSQSLKGGHVAERVAWMELTLRALQRTVSRGTNDEQVVRVLPKVMGLVNGRIEKLYDDVSQRAPPMDNSLQSLSNLLGLIAAIVEENGRALNGNHVGAYIG